MKFSRRILVQIHCWTGIGVGLYIFVVCVTGAALVFRSEMQEALYPGLFDFGASGAAPAAITTVMREVRAAYPEHELAGVYPPTPTRQPYLAYVVKDHKSSIILADPAIGKLLGDFPEHSFVRSLQELHFNLLAGRRSRFLNGVGALLLLVMCLTGLVIWWPGVCKVDFRKNWKRLNWKLHNAAGFWTVALAMVWAVSGAYLSFPQQFQAVVNWFSPVTSSGAAPASDPELKGRHTVVEIPALIAKAERAQPDARLYGMMLPDDDKAAFTVVMARWKPHNDNPEYIYVYCDQFSSELLGTSGKVNRTVGDVIMAWLVPLHVGAFGWLPIKILWAVLGLSPPLLFIPGVLMWWNRLVRR